ncbi:hypothetical protein BDN72DRAFT_778715, partial [Pluteus cervinus]
VHFFVPKFHLPAHVGSCQTIFSFNLDQNAGRIDGDPMLIGLPQIPWRYALVLGAIRWTTVSETGTGGKRR